MSKVTAKDTTWQFMDKKIKTNIYALIKEVNDLNEEWLLDTSRQNLISTHRDTEMFQIRFASYLWFRGEPLEIKEVNSFKNKEAMDALLSVFKELEDFYNGKVVRCEVIKMHKNSNIPPHVDSSDFLSTARRVHVPIITNEKVLFTVFGKSINMKVGNWYEINNSLPHSVSNNSDQDRVHIICDILENEYLV